MYKNGFTTSIFVLFLVLVFASCRDNASQSAIQENEAELKETARLDSLATDLEATTKAIEVQTKELQSALDAL